MTESNDKGMRRLPSFSVVMSTYSGDRPEWLREAGQSIFMQSQKPDELIMVLDGDVGRETHDVIADLGSLGTVRVIALPKNVGPGMARHKGIVTSKNDVVAIMDADDICRPDRFETQLQVLADDRADVVGAWISEFDLLVGDKEKFRKVPEMHEDIVSYARKRTPMNNVTAMFQKSFYIKAGGYSGMRANEDYDLYVKMILSNARFYNIQRVLVDVRGGPDLSSRRGGLEQVPDDTRMFFLMYKKKFINGWQLIFNIGVRVFLRVLPNKWREKFYQIFLRD